MENRFELGMVKVDVDSSDAEMETPRMILPSVNKSIYILYIYSIYIAFSFLFAHANVRLW